MTNLAQTTWTPIVDAQELYQLLTSRMNHDITGYELIHIEEYLV